MTKIINAIAPSYIMLDGIEIPAGYSVSYTGRTVTAILTMDGQRYRVTFTAATCGEMFTAALAAAKQNVATEVDGEGLGVILGTAEPLPQERKPREIDPAKQRHGEVPEKLFIGTELTGKSWRILFDGDAGKTRVIFPRKPSAKVIEAVKAAGFYWSPSMKSWNKGLTFRAFRAAEKLHAELHALTA